VIYQKVLKVIPLAISIFILYWFTSLAYHKVKKPFKLDNLPLIMKSPCSVEHFLINKDIDTNDLSLYYSGIKEEKLPDSSLKNKFAEEDKIQEKLLEIVKNRTKDIKSEELEGEIKIPVVKQLKEEKNSKKVVKPKKEKKQEDAFSKKKSSVFDLVE
jgi:hypothetical protein